jgi:hypothetical protein
MARRQAFLILFFFLVLGLARPCGAWVVFDGKRLEQAVPLGQRAKNSSDVLTAAETMRLVLSDGFPGAFRWSARSSLRYAISPDFCAAMRGTMVEEDNWLRDTWPIKPSIRWATCDRLHQIVRQAFDTWQENNPALHLVDVTDRCTAERGWLPIDQNHCADSPLCRTLYATTGSGGAGSTAVDDNNQPEFCSSKACFECERADINIGAFVQGGRQLADPSSRLRVLGRRLSDQPPLGTNGLPQPGGVLEAARLEILVDSKYFASESDEAIPTGENFTQAPHCWRLDADWCPRYVAWGQQGIRTASTALFGVLFFLCCCGCLCGCLVCLQKLVTNLLAGWDLDQDGKVEVHEIMYVLDEFCGEICFECRCPNLHQQKMSTLEGVLGVLETVTQMNAGIALAVVGCCIILPMAYATEVSTCWACGDLRAALVHEVGHLLALDNSDAYSSNVTFTHAADASSYPPHETALLDCLNPETGVVLGTPAESEQGVMRSYLLTNANSPPPGHCLSTDDLAALNYLYPSCASAMLIYPACGARASGRAPATRLLHNFGAVFCVPAAVIVGVKLIALLVVGLQTEWARRKLSASAKAVVGEAARQGRLARIKLGGRRKRSGEDEVQANIDRAKKRIEAYKKRKARREAKAKAKAARGSNPRRPQLRGAISSRTSKVATAAGRYKCNDASGAAGPAPPPAAAPEAAVEGVVPADATPPVAHVSPARRALEEEIQMSAERTEERAVQLAKKSKKAAIRAEPKAYVAAKQATQMAAKAAELKRISAYNSDHSSSLRVQSISSENVSIRRDSQAEQAEGGITYLNKAKSKGKAPVVASDLGF